MNRIELARMTWKEAAAARDRGAEIMDRVVAKASSFVKTFAKLQPRAK